MLSPLEERLPRILVVDDHPAQFEVMRRMLRNIGEAHHAINGLEAFLMVSELEYDAILMDIVLDEVSGLRLASALRKGKLVQTAPIIAYSAGWDPKPYELIASGCNDFLSVPFADGELENKVLFWLNKKVLFPPTDRDL